MSFDIYKTLKHAGISDYFSYKSLLTHSSRGAKIPFHAHFELTPICTLDCKMCYVHLSKEEMMQRGRLLTKNEWINIAKEAKDIGLVSVTLSGGEVFTREDFLSIYSELYDMDLLLSVSSNATIISDDAISMFMQKPPDSVTITLYGFSYETYKKVCGNGEAFNSVIVNIDRLLDAGIKVNLQTTTTKENYCDIPSIKEYAKERGISYRHMSCLGMYREAKSEEIRKIDIVEQQMDSVANSIALAEENANIVFDGFLCGAGNNSFSISWNGVMQPCITVDFIQSNVLQNGIESSWKYIVYESQKVPQLIECQKCKYRYHCNLCLSNHYNDTHEFGKPSPRLCYKVQHGITD